MILTTNRLSSYLRMLLAVYFLGCVGFFAVRTAHWTQVNDPAQLHYLCFLMDHGMAPYRDLLEINMPGIYLVNWSVMHTLGGGSAAWRAFDFSLMAMAAWAMVSIARPYDWLAGVFGATLFILFHGRDGAGQEGQRDFVIAVLLLCAYSFLFYSFRSRRKWPMFAFGLCGGIASTIKPMPLPFVLLLLLLAAIRWKRLGEPILKPSLYALSGLMVPLSIVAIFLVSKHALGSFWYVLRVELPFYQRLGLLPLHKLLVSDHHRIVKDRGPYRISDCGDQAGLVELGRQIAGGWNFIRRRILPGPGKGLSLPSLPDAGISFFVGRAANYHRLWGPASLRPRVGDRRSWLRCDPRAYLREQG